MTEDGHRQAVVELKRTRARLMIPDDIRAYTEICFGIAFHLLAIGAHHRHGMHREKHDGLGRWLRDRGHVRQAEILAELESIGTGRWYGRQTKGSAARPVDELLAELDAWAMAREGHPAPPAGIEDDRGAAQQPR